MIVFAADDDERVHPAVKLCQSFENSRGAAVLIFLVHAVEQRESLLGCIDYGSRVAAPAEGCSKITNDSDAGSRFPNRAVEDRGVH